MNQRSRGDEADTIIVNGKVWTGTPAQAEAVAIRGERIIAVGSTAQVRELAGPGTRVVDAEGRRIIPGITDSHTHLLWAGESLARLDLRGVRSKAEFIAAVASGVSRLAPGQWLLGGQFAAEHWDVPEQPDKRWLDAVAPDHPVFLTRADLHMGVCNSRALALAGITGSGPADPPGGEIERGSDGVPTGIVKDAAMELVEAAIPAPTEAESDAALSAACTVANGWGITSIHDMSLPEHVAAYLGFEARRGLTLRAHCYWTAVDFAEAHTRWPALGRGDGYVRVVGFKAFMDGSLGSRTAYFREPYADAPPGAKHPRGMLTKWTADMDAFRGAVRWAHERRIQLAVHAIGDQAVHDLLEVYAALPDVTERRHRVEHAQHLLPEDVGRFAALGVVASMQPIHQEDDGPWMEAALGAERMATSYAWRSLLDAGAAVCFGSDVPVATNNPFAGIAQAVTSRLPDGRICPGGERIGLETALRCYTAAPAWAVFREHELGTLAAGKLADLAILDRDILSMPIEEIGETKAWMTMVGGRVVWSADKAAL